jgi:hypothetical protein
VHVTEHAITVELGGDDIRTVRRTPTQAVRSIKAHRGGDLDTTGVREWARAQGIEVKDRGRVPAGVVARFRAATGR